MRPTTAVRPEEALRAAAAPARLLRQQFGAREVHGCRSGYELVWDEIHPRVEGMPGTLAELRPCLRPFG